MSLRLGLVAANVIAIVLILIAAVLSNFPLDASAGQLIVDIILLPTVIIGFVLGIAELRKLQEIPDLDVLWTETDTIELEKSDRSMKIVRLAPIIINKGNTSAYWFTVQLEVPRELVVNSRNIKFFGVIGEKSNWKQWENRSDYAIVSFGFTLMSNGQMVMYPGYKMPLCYIDFYLFPNVEYPNQCELSHTIITDKTKPKRGSCIVNIEPENLARKIPAEWLLENMLLRNIFPSKRKDRR